MAVGGLGGGKRNRNSTGRYEVLHTVDTRGRTDRNGGGERKRGGTVEGEDVPPPPSTKFLPCPFWSIRSSVINHVEKTHRYLLACIHIRVRIQFSLYLALTIPISTTSVLFPERPR